jgi:hypothetical protein
MLAFSPGDTTSFIPPRLLRFDKNVISVTCVE